MSCWSTPTTRGTCWWLASGRAGSMPTRLLGSTPRTRTPAPQTAWSPSLDAALSPRARMAELTAPPQALLLLANLGRRRRPAGAAAPYSEPILPGSTVAAAQLAGVVDQSVAAADLVDLRRLQRAAVHAAEAILAGGALDCAEINALAADSTARVELNALEPDRLRRCARPECDLIFYDTTRSHTRRWHAEDPCGWRERQRVHRTRTLVPNSS